MNTQKDEQETRRDKTTQKFPYLRNTVMIETNGKCNLQCRYCYTKQPSSWSKMVSNTGDMQLDKNELISFIDRFLNFINEPAELCWIGRGEVSLYHPLAELVNRYSRLYKVTHYIQTNGIDASFIDDIERTDNLILGVSLDGFKEDNDYNRGKGTFDKIIATIQKFVASGVKVNVHSILTPRNFEKARDFMKFIKVIDENISVSFARLFLDEQDDELDAMSKKIEKDYPDIMARIGVSVDDVLDDKRYMCISCDGFIFDCCDLINKIGDIRYSEPPDILSMIDSGESCSKCAYRSSCYPDVFMQ